MSWHASEALMNTIKHYASFPATGVSLRQMVQFGARPSTGKNGAFCFSTLFLFYLMAMKDLAMSRPLVMRRERKMRLREMGMNEVEGEDVSVINWEMR